MHFGPPTVRRQALTLGQRTLARIAFDGVEPERVDGEEQARVATLLGPVDSSIPSEAHLVLAAVKCARTDGAKVAVE